MRHNTVKINLQLPKSLLDKLDQKREDNIAFVSRNTFIIQILDKHVNPERAA